MLSVAGGWGSDAAHTTQAAPLTDLPSPSASSVELGNAALEPSMWLGEGVCGGNTEINQCKGSRARRE